jgi:sorbitol/mannitol transport system permease protein
MNDTWKSKLYHIVLWIVALAYFFPVLWIILSAFKTKNDLLENHTQRLFSPTLATFPNIVPRETL